MIGGEIIVGVLIVPVNHLLARQHRADGILALDWPVSNRCFSVDAQIVERPSTRPVREILKLFATFSQMRRLPRLHFAPLHDQHRSADRRSEHVRQLPGAGDVGGWFHSFGSTTSILCSRAMRRISFSASDVALIAPWSSSAGEPL